MGAGLESMYRTDHLSMRDNALYFPYISLPNIDWTVKSLLYWDKLSSIVPMEYIDRPDQLSPFMRELVEGGLVEQIFPTHYLYRIKQFEQCFIGLIERKAKVLAAKQSGDLKLIKPRTRIHMEKLGNIPEFLMEQGLAERVNLFWYDIDTRIANIFMAYLASCLGAVPEVNAAPVTNLSMYSSIFGYLNHSYRRDNAIHHDKARQVVLRELLPTPNESVTPDQLVRFKECHGHLLPALRRKIEAHCAQVAVLKNAEDQITLTEDFIGQCRLEIDEIVDAMKPTWKRISFGSISPLFGAGLAWYTTDTGNHLAYASAALSFAGAAYQAISSISDNRDKLLSRPLAYIAHAHSGIYA
jgi:hypothetical protein